MKKLLTLLMLLCMVCAGAWADGVMPENIKLSTNDHKVYYTIKGKSNEYAYYSSTSGNKVQKQTRINLTSLFYFTASDVTPTKDGFRAVKIHNFSAGNACMENWTTWSETGSTYYLHAAFGTSPTAGSVNICTFEIEASTTNTNACWNHQTSGVLGWTARNNKGAAETADVGSCWVIEEYDGPVPGNVYTIENAQQGSHFYPLYVTNSTLTIGTKDKPIADFSVYAQWLAESNAVGKMSFKNVATGEYLIWRGNTSGGYNNNKGTNPSYVASYCDWDMYKGTGDYSEYYRICSKRNDNTDGSLTIHNGNFDGYGNSDYWNSAGTNVLRFTKVENPHNPEMPVAGKVYTVFNDHVGVPYFVSKNRTVNANAQDITATRTTDGSQEWIFWGDATNNYKFYNLSDNSIALKSYNGQETHKVINERKRIGYTIVQPTNGSKRIGGDTHNPSLDGGIFSSGTYNEHVNGDLHWSTDFVFVPTGENAYKVVIVNGASNTSVTYGGKTVSNNGFLTVAENVTADAICAELTTNNAPTGFSSSVSAEGNVITLTYSPVPADGIYEINNQSGSNSRGYFVHSASYPNAPVLAETSLSGYTDRDVTDNRHDGSVNPYFGVKTIGGKTYIYSLANGKFLNTSWSDTAVGYTLGVSSRNANYVTLQNTNQSGSQFLCNACGNNGGVDGHTIYTGNNDGGNDFVFEPVDASKVAELRGTYASQIEAAEFAINGGWNMVYTGLTSPAEGGVTYLCTNYTGEKIMLPLNLDRDGLIAMHVSGYNGLIESVNTETHTITVAYDQNYTATNVLWDGNGDVSNTKVPAARIPAMIKAHNGDILAFSDWRYSRDDVGRESNFNLGYQVDIEMRRSRDNGRTWSPAIIAANGDGGNDRTTAGYGDASVVADSESDNVLLMCVNAAGSNRFVRFTSSNNGETWSGPTNIASDIATVAPTSTFFTSGKMIQAKTFKKTNASFKRIYAPLCGGNAGDYVLYSDDFGQNWSRLGEGAAQTGSSDECRLIELPNGDILLDSRAGSVRKINVFTYTDRETGAGSWGEQNVNGSMPTADCNGDIDIVTGYAIGDDQPVQILIESAPRGSNNGGTRAHVQYYYKVLTEGQYTLNDLKSGWVAGLEVCEGKSAYSSIIDLGNGSEAILYEKAHAESETGYHGNPWGYDIKFETHTLNQITNGAYTTEAFIINYTLTDANGQTYVGSCVGKENVEPTFTGAHGYTLSNQQWGEVEDNHVTFTARIDFGFPVSSNGQNKWVNLKYLPNYARYMSYDGTNAKMAQQYRDSGKSEGADNISKTNWIWSLTPVLEENNTFSFKIYSKGANKYVTASNIAHQAVVTLAAESEAATFQLLAPVTTSFNDHTLDNTAKGVLAKEVNGTTFCINIESATSSSYATFWSGGNHAGKNLNIVEAWDMQEYDALLEQVQNTGTHLGEYSISNVEQAEEKVADCADNRDDMTQYYEHIATMKDMASHKTLNMPQPGMFLRIKASDTNKTTGYSLTEDQNLYLTSENSTQNTGRAAFTLVEGQSNAANTIFYYNDGKLVAYSNGLLPISSSNFWKMGAVGEDGVVVNFEEIGRSIEAGAYRIEFNNGGRSLYTQKNNSNYFTDAAGGNSTGEHYRYFLEEVTSLPVNIGATKFATFYTPVELKVPAEVTAYVCNLNGEDLRMFSCKQVDSETVTLIPAGTAVMLNAPEQTEATSYDFAIPTTTQAEAYSNNSFFGSVATKAFDTNFTYYSLQRDNAANDGTVGFFIKPSGNFKGFQAFLKTETTQQVQRFNVTFDEDAVVTGFANVLGNVNITIPAFDLSGRKVDANTHRGIYIMNGKKVIR